MKITDVTVHAVKGRHWPRFPMFFVEVHTDDGITGVGEALGYRSTGVAQAIRELGADLVGSDPRRIESLWERMMRRGGNLAAVSGIETALWDILGKSLGAPVYQLLGGLCHERIRLYADGFFRGAAYVEAEYAQKAVDAVALGLTALKMDLDEPIPSGHSLNRSLSSGDLALTVRMVESVRRAVGDGVDLCIDAHGAFDVPSAVRLGRSLEAMKLMWVEDPVAMDNMAAMAKVAAEVETPICTGELMETRFAFRELLERQAADVIMPDLARTGGLMEMKKIAAAADTYHVPVAPHNMVGPIATIASGHFAASTPNFMILEYQMGDVPWIDELLGAPVPIEGGDLVLPARPGLGFELNHKAVTKYRAD